MVNILKKLGKAAIAVATLVSAQQALAQVGTSAGTLAGTDVVNNVSVAYSLGGNSQTPSTSSFTFKVDRKINVIVAEIGTEDTFVVPNATDRVTAFTVTNASNDRIDVALSVLQDLLTGPRGNTDTFNVTTVRIFEDNGDSSFGAGDVELTGGFLDSLERTADGNPTAGIKTIFVVANIPSGLANDAAAVITLTAQARQNVVNNDGTLGPVFTETAGVDDPAVIDNVFADGDGPASDDANRDGKHSDDDAYRVSLTALVVTKTATTINHTIGADTFTGNDAKAIPGAVIEYCILMSNTGNQAATTVVVTDTLPAEVTYETGTLRSGATCANANTVEDDDNGAGGTDDDTTDGFGASFSAGVVSANVASIAATNGTAALRFRVKVK